MGQIDHGRAETALQLQRELPNGQWSSLGIHDQSTIRDDAEAFQRDYPMWKMRVRRTVVEYVPLDEFLK